MQGTCNNFSSLESINKAKSFYCYVENALYCDAEFNMQKQLFTVESFSENCLF